MVRDIRHQRESAVELNLSVMTDRGDLLDRPWERVIHGRHVS